MLCAIAVDDDLADDGGVAKANEDFAAWAARLSN
jgi:hypothetical protein